MPLPLPMPVPMPESMRIDKDDESTRLTKTSQWPLAAKEGDGDGFIKLQEARCANPRSGNQSASALAPCAQVLALTE